MILCVCLDVNLELEDFLVKWNCLIILNTRHPHQNWGKEGRSRIFWQNTALAWQKLKKLMGKVSMKNTRWLLIQSTWCLHLNVFSKVPGASIEKFKRYTSHHTQNESTANLQFLDDVHTTLINDFYNFFIILAIKFSHIKFAEQFKNRFLLSRFSLWELILDYTLAYFFVFFLSRRYGPL